MKTVAYIGGTFDVLHIGHTRLFKAVKKNYDIIVVSVNTDEFNYRYKGRYPIIPAQHRIEMLYSLKDVDQVIVNYGDEDSKPAILSVMPDAIIHGSDMSREVLMKQMMLTDKFLKEYHIDIDIYPHTDEDSSTAIIQRCQDQLKLSSPDLTKT
jgi:cytidyltransferase-like protein